MRDPFRPRRQLARLIYDALLAEAKNRNGKTCDEWIMNERIAMLRVARDYALFHGLTVPTQDDAKIAEDHGSGHTDYAAKVAYRLAEIIETR